MSASRPKVSIGLPVYNGEESIAAALRSLISQTYTNIEIIISDNASTDRTLTICREFESMDLRIRVIAKELNEGAVANFKTVLSASKGEYFLWAASDDLWHEDFILKLLLCLETNSKACVAMSAIERRLPDGRLYDVLRFDGPRNPNGIGCVKLFYKCYSGVKFSLFIYGLFRVGKLKATIDNFPEIAGGDRLFMSLLALTFPFAYVDEILHVRTYQAGHAESYLRQMAHPGIVWRQTRTIVSMVLRSRRIPFLRKALALIILPKFVSHYLKQARLGRKFSSMHPDKG